MMGLDIDKLTHGITRPFIEILEAFNGQMNQLHQEVKRTNELLEEIAQQGRDDEAS